MDLQGMAPIMVYDDRCRACAGFARLAYRASRGRITMIGHYTEEGRAIGKVLGGSAREMFWVIDGRRAFGGRAALLPLLRAVLGGGRARRRAAAGACGDGCGAGAVFARSASLLLRSERIDL